MSIPVSLPGAQTRQSSFQSRVVQNLPKEELPDIGKQMEQMLWVEMLSHAGLEKAFTTGGGEAASAFTRFLVEEIASDLAEKHPLGLGGSLDLNGNSDEQLKFGEVK